MLSIHLDFVREKKRDRHLKQSHYVTNVSEIGVQDGSHDGKGWNSNFHELDLELDQENLITEILPRYSQDAYTQMKFLAPVVQKL